MIITLIYQDNLHIVSGNNKINSKFAFTLQMLQFIETPYSNVLSKKKNSKRKRKKMPLKIFWWIIVIKYSKRWKVKDLINIFPTNTTRVYMRCVCNEYLFLVVQEVTVMLQKLYDLHFAMKLCFAQKRLQLVLPLKIICPKAFPQKYPHPY